MARILIVDDNHMVREALRYTLKDKYHVATACEAQDAYRYMASCAVDLVLLDLKMPKIDGITALREIKKKHPDTEVIIMTAYAPADAVQNAFSSGASAFLMKPFDINKLIDTIDDALQRSHISHFGKGGLREIL